MATIRLSAYEVQCGRLPMVCVRCGRDASDQMEWRLSAIQHYIIYRVRTTISVVLPACPEHRTQGLFIWSRVVAKHIDQRGVTLGNVSPYFLDAVEDFRDNPDDYRRPGTDYDRRRSPAERRNTPTGSSGSSGSATIWIVLGVLGAMFFGVVLLCGGLIVLARMQSGAPQPGFNAPGDPGWPARPTFPQGPTRPPFRP
jgi:hypothetical protein